MTSDKPARLSAENIGRAALLGIPYLGPSLDRFIFGPLEELRWQRIQATLTEIAERLRKRGIPPDRVENEDFANLLAAVGPALSRATNEDKRQRFRDLLLNAAQTPPGDPTWEEARLAGRLLDEIDAPGLAILAAVASIPQDRITLSAHPTPRTLPGEVNIGLLMQDGPEARAAHIPLSYSWPVIEEWARRLREMRLIGLSSHDARGGFGGVYLNTLGKLLVRWARDSGEGSEQIP